MWAQDWVPGGGARGSQVLVVGVCVGTLPSCLPRCAHCRALIRLKRGQGKVHGKCPRCQTEYDQNT